MSTHEYFTSNLIPFSKEPALLGVDTNGASPERVYGLFIGAEIYKYNDEITENYWLKATLTKGNFDKQATGQEAEFLMWSPNVQQMDMVIGSIVSASVIKNWNKTLNGKFDSYQNLAQQEFSDEATSECIDNLGCRVNSTDTGFAIRFFDRNTTISSLHAKLEDKAITTALDEIKSLREWSDKCQRALLKEIAARREDTPAAAPALR
jgi:hypothetical protein